MPVLKVKLDKMRRQLLEIAPTNSDLERLLHGVAAVARQRWIRKAQDGLKTTARDYIAGIQNAEVEDRVASVTLTGTVPNMVEQGASEFDMRTTLLGPDARNAKTAEDGSRYNTVPFRHGTPGTGGRNVGEPMPREIHSLAKKLEPTLSRPGSKTSWGDRIHLGQKMTNAARAILMRKERSWHQTSIYMGMVKQQKTYESATQSQYTTFRRISSKVRRGNHHWVHPGIQARHFAKEVQREVGDIVKSVLGSTMKGK